MNEMVAIDPTTLSERDNYKILTGTIIPRPVAFVTTLTENETINAAPFSYFNIVSANPPLVSVAVQRHPNSNEKKDTARNAIQQGEFVVHLGDEYIVEDMNQTAATLPPEESELSHTSLTTIPSDRVKVPSLKEARIRFECTLEHHLEVGGTEEQPACDLLIGRIVAYHIDDALYDEEKGYIRTDLVKPVSRLAGQDYAKLGEIFSIERPS